MSHSQRSYIDGEMFKLVGIAFFRATLEGLDFRVWVNLERVREVEQGLHPVHDETVVECQRFHGRRRTIFEVSRILIDIGTLSEFGRLAITSLSPKILEQFGIIYFSTLPWMRTPGIGRFCRRGTVRLWVRSIVTMTEDRRNASGRGHVWEKANHFDIRHHSARLSEKMKTCV